MLDSKTLPRPVVRKRSTAFSALTLGCASNSAYSDDYPPSRTSTLSDSDEKHSFEQPPPLYASTADLLDDDVKAAQAYKAFLKQYPEYTLTWILDALRRSDFARLDRSGETYVDYMGGSLYPESLIRVHTGFLQRSVLGNTRSINNA
jgi:molybdenum cofactor sulfurtransferase